MLKKNLMILRPPDREIWVPFLYKATLLFIAAVCIFCLPGGVSHAGRVIPDNNLGYPVNISLHNGGQGSGFYVNTDNFTYLVTAKHVILDSEKKELKATKATLTSYGRDPADLSQMVIEVNLDLMLREHNIRFHRNGDAATVKLARLEKQGGKQYSKFFPAAKILQHSKTGLVSVSVNNVKNISEVLIANDVFLFGYPSSIGIKDIPQINYDRPLLRKGIVAGVNLDRNSIIIDAAVYPGNSGGPVLQAEPYEGGINFYLIGLVSELVPYAEKWIKTRYGTSYTEFSNSGYAVVVPCDFILELLKDSEKAE